MEGVREGWREWRGYGRDREGWRGLGRDGGNSGGMEGIEGWRGLGRE